MPQNTYELTYVINGGLGNDQIRNLVRRASRFIEEHGGKVVELDEWGTQRLAYPVQKKRNGYYVNVCFEAPGNLIARLERALALEDNVLRFLTLKMDAKMLRVFRERLRKRNEALEAGNQGGSDTDTSKASRADVSK